MLDYESLLSEAKEKASCKAQLMYSDEQVKERKRCENELTREYYFEYTGRSLLHFDI